MVLLHNRVEYIFELNSLIRVKMKISTLLPIIVCAAFFVMQLTRPCQNCVKIHEEPSLEGGEITQATTLPVHLPIYEHADGPKNDTPVLDTNL